MLSPLTAAERRQLEPVIEKLLGALTSDRWNARHICRLCDIPTCEMPACPVDQAIPQPGLPINAAAAARAKPRASTLAPGQVRPHLIWQPHGPCPRPTSRLVFVQTSYGLVPIGWVQSALKVLDDAPNQREGAPRAWIRFDEQVAEGAKDLRPGDEIVVLTWLHLSRRDELSTHPEDDMSQPLTGVFSTCSPSRPNPIGLHRARIVARDGLQIEVDALEAIDGTPVVDVKAGHPPARMTRCARPTSRWAGLCVWGPGPPPIAERGWRSGGSRAKSRRSALILWPS